MSEFEEKKMIFQIKWNIEVELKQVKYYKWLQISENIAWLVLRVQV